jgi:Flp pilus assembly protein TadG
VSTYIRHLRARRARGDRGAVLIESALVFPIFFLIVLGIIEYGFYQAASSTTTSSARDGARYGSAAFGPASSKVTEADAIRTLVAQDLHALSKRDTPQRLWVYKAAADGSPCVNVACASGTGFVGSPTVACPDVVCYRYTAWNSSTRTFGTRAGAWVTVDACPPALDTIGVHLQVTHRWLARILGGAGPTLNEQTVLRLEPLPDDQCLGP